MLSAEPLSRTPVHHQARFRRVTASNKPSSRPAALADRISDAPHDLCPMVHLGSPPPPAAFLIRANRTAALTKAIAVLYIDVAGRALRAWSPILLGIAITLDAVGKLLRLLGATPFGCRPRPVAPSTERSPPLSLGLGYALPRTCLVGSCEYRSANHANIDACRFRLSTGWSGWACTTGSRFGALR